MKNQSKWSSRKFISAIVAVAYTIAATVGLEQPVSEVILVDAVCVLYIVVEGIIDMLKKY